MSRKARPGLADYVAMAICPALIMALVSSLVFFLLEILYAGQYATRLQWLIFLFVFGTVLIARISMEKDIADRTSVYGAALGIVTFLTMNALVEYPAGTPLVHLHWFVNLGLMAIIWWCAHRLTWDCTFIDEEAEASGAGLLEVAGLEAPDESEAEPQDNYSADKPARKKKQATGFAAWWERYRAYREHRRRQPHAPGVWIIYFSLAALPIFGLGQSLIPVTEVARRRYAFWLLGVYVASGLTLLLTTSFLGLRRYLRQRGLQMPGSITGVWLAIGTAIVALLLVVGAFMPRPDPEYPLFDLTRFVRSPDRQASRWAPLRDSPGKGTSASGADDDEDANESGDGAQQNQQSGGESGQRPGQDPSQDGQGQQQGQSGDSSQNSSGGNQQQGQAGRQSKTGSNSGKSRGSKSGRQSNGSSPLRLPERLQTPLRSILPVLKWLVFAVIAIIVAVILFRALLKFLANFTAWARHLLEALQDLWRSLFGWGAAGERPELAAEEQRPQERPRPFAAYINPFLYGGDGQRTPEQLVRYSFEALEAWAWERGLSRHDDETPVEFGLRLGETIPDFEANVRRLTFLYARVAYASGSLPTSSLTAVEEFWQRLETIETSAAPA